MTGYLLAYTCASTHEDQTPDDSFFLSFFSDTGVTDGCKLTILDAGSII